MPAPTTTYQERRAAGVCVRCRKTAEPGRVMCRYHLDKNTGYTKANRDRNKAARGRKLRALNLNLYRKEAPVATDPDAADFFANVALGVDYAVAVESLIDAVVDEVSDAVVDEAYAAVIRLDPSNGRLGFAVGVLLERRIMAYEKRIEGAVVRAARDKQSTV